MRGDLVYRVLSHLTLALAGACLVVAEAQFLPEMQVGLVPFLGLVLAALLVEGRWVLPAWGANLLGLLIAGGAGWWLVARLGEEDTWMELVPAPAAAVPYLGPVIMALLVVRLFRPREPGDFWLLQGMGLLQVSLGCVLATSPLFGVLLLAYLLCGLCCLAAHYRWSERGGTEPVGRAPSAAGWLAFALRWGTAAAALALPLYLLTPRGDGQDWDPLLRFGVRPPNINPTATGFREEINLNSVGAVQVDDGMAFTVSVREPTGQPKTDLPADQRWRGTVLDSYSEGRWTLRLPSNPVPMFRGRLGPLDTGPDSYALTFTVQPQRAGGLFLADPVPLGPRANQLPVQALGEPRDQRNPPLFYEVQGNVLPLAFPVRQEYRYRQTVSPTQPRDRYPAVRRSEDYIENLLRQPVPGLGKWTDEQLRKLVGQPRYRQHRLVLPPAPEGGNPEPLLPPPQWQPAALLLTDYLAHSGEYTYTLERPRHDTRLDPVLDFLVNVKQGHCDRYATALVLMLRSLGMPARVVKGYRGADHDGQGEYVVRHSHAHSWVEVLVPRGDPDAGEFDWLELDPTPLTDAPQADTSFSLLRWWQESRWNNLGLWRSLFLDYNASLQADLWEALSSGRPIRALARAGWPLALAALALVAWVVLRRRARRPRAAPAPTVAFYARLLALLARHAGLRPRRGQTPREFAAEAAGALTRSAGAAALADVPQRVAEAFYRVRFGQQALDGAEEAELGANLEALAAALRQA
jgi:hypothetical protein